MAAPQITVNFDPPLASDSGTAFDTKAFDTVAKLNPWGLEANTIADYCGEQAGNALAAALGGDLPPLTGQSLKYLRVNAGETAAEFAAINELSQVQVEDDASTVFGQVSGQRLAQAVDAGLVRVGPVKAWVNFNGTGTVAIRDSLNVSSITDNGTGDYTINFSQAFPDANYATAITAAQVAGLLPRPSITDGGQSAGALRTIIYTHTNALIDWSVVHVTAFN